MKRNHDKYTDEDTAKRNILLALLRAEPEPSAESQLYGGLVKSDLGYAAYPGYRFLRAQGAAFAVAKICRHLHNEGLIQMNPSHRWTLTLAGYQAAETAKNTTTEDTL